MLPVHDVADRPPEAQAPAARTIKADSAVQVRPGRGRVPVRWDRQAARPVALGRQRRAYSWMQEGLTMMTGGVHTGTTNPARGISGTVLPASAISGRAECKPGEHPARIRRRLSDHVPGREILHG